MRLLAFCEARSDVRLASALIDRVLRSHEGADLDVDGAHLGLLVEREHGVSATRWHGLQHNAAARSADAHVQHSNRTPCIAMGSVE